MDRAETLYFSESCPIVHFASISYAPFHSLTFIIKLDTVSMSIGIFGGYQGIAEVYSKVLESASAVGKIKQESKQLGVICIRTPLKFFPPMNPLDLRITLKKKDQDTYLVSSNADSFDGAVGLGSPVKVINKTLAELSARL